MATLAYKIQLVTDQKANDTWRHLLIQSADAYNTCANMIKEREVPLKLKYIHRVVYAELREKFPEIPAQSIIKTYKAVLSAYRSIRGNKHHNAETPRKKQLSMVLDKRLYAKLNVDGISLTGEIPNKRVHHDFVMYDKAREMFAKYKTGDPTIFYRDGKLWLSVPFIVSEQPVAGDSCVGVDLGIKRLFTTSDGVAFRDSNYLKNRRKVRYLKRRLSSKGTKSARRHLRKLRKHEEHMSTDMQYRAVKALLSCTDSPYIVMEDLKRIKESTKTSEAGHNRKRHNNRMSQVSFASFRYKLTAKAPLFGRKVETVNPAYTSQTDSRTGKKNGIRKGCRYYCKDGVVLDADWNAAVNIARKSRHPLSNVHPVDGCLVFLSGRGRSIPQSYVSPRTGALQAHGFNRG